MAQIERSSTTRSASHRTRQASLAPLRMLVLCALAAACNLAPPPAQAVVPLVLGLGKQILQNMIFNGVKMQLIGTLAQQGCKGAALVSLFSQAEQTALLKRGPSGFSGVQTARAGGAEMAGPVGRLPPTSAAPTASPLGRSTPQGGGFLGGLMNKLRQVPGGDSTPTAAPEAAPEGGSTSGAAAAPSDFKPLDQGKRPGVLVVSKANPDATELLYRMQEQRAQSGMAPSRGTLTPEQMQKSAAVMDQMQDAMAHPLSRAETLTVFDELQGMGMLTADMHAQARECILLAPESAAQAIGGSGAMFKSVVLPALGDMQARLAALPPDQQQQLVDQLSQALREAKPADRKAFRDGLGAGFFPPAVLHQLRARGALD